MTQYVAIKELPAMKAMKELLQQIKDEVLIPMRAECIEAKQLLEARKAEVETEGTGGEAPQAACTGPQGLNAPARGPLGRPNETHVEPGVGRLSDTADFDND